MADIFISYAREDAALASRLRDGIEAHGLSAWLDTTSIDAGQTWTEEIESAIKAARAVVVVVSRFSNESKWVRREALYAQQLGTPVMPMRAEEVPLPAHLVDLQTVSVHQDFAHGVDRLVTALRGQPVSAPAPAVAAAGETSHRTARALWLFAGAAVFVVLVVIALRREGVVAEVVATALAIGGALLAMAWKADDAISPEFKRDLSLFLDRLDPGAVGESVQRWPAHFAVLFDRVFGKKHRSWRCFFRSSVASMLAFVLCTLIYIQAAPGEWASFLKMNIPREEAAPYTPFLVLGGLAAILNLLPDYLSLLETRYVIRRVQQSRSFAGQLGWLVVDFLATGAIFFLMLQGVLIGMAGFLALMQNKSVSETISTTLAGGMGNIPTVLKISLLIPVADPGMRWVAIPVWTTYFTSLWVWLYFIAQFLTRAAAPLRHTLGFLQYALPVRDRPLRAVGQVMAFVACVGYCAVMLPAAMFGDSALAGYLGPDMVVIDPGRFRMGDLTGHGEPDERPVRTVTIAEPFAIGKYEVTFEEYDRFAEATDRALPDDEGWGRGPRPVINVSWEDAVAYAEWLSEQTGERYRLPTEAEWEYAARAGTTTRYWWANDVGQNNANCEGCGSQWDNKQTAKVGSFAPNPFGLYDTAGNVYEWVQDCWHGSYKGAPNDGSAWLTKHNGDCRFRVVRGGAWNDGPNEIRSSLRIGGLPVDRFYNLGFRLAQDL